MRFFHNFPTPFSLPFSFSSSTVTRPEVPILRMFVARLVTFPHVQCASCVPKTCPRALLALEPVACVCVAMQPPDSGGRASTEPDSDSENLLQIMSGGEPSVRHTQRV